VTDMPDPGLPPPIPAGPSAPSMPTPDPYHPPQVEGIMRQAREVVASARPMPLSASSMINKEDLLGMLDEAIARLPDDLRAARWLLKEREEFLAKVRREGDEILEMARSQAERLVQRTEVVRTAEQRARQLVEMAREETRRMRRETEDYCDQKLATFEASLTDARDTIATGRRKLQETVLDRERRQQAEVVEQAAQVATEEAQRPRSSSSFFDQDDDEPSG